MKYQISEVGIHLRKQESKKTRFRPRNRSRKKESKHVLDQGSDQEKRKITLTVKKKRIKHALDPESDQEILFFLDHFIGRFLGQERVFFLFSFINSHLCKHFDGKSVRLVFNPFFRILVKIENSLKHWIKDNLHSMNY